MRRDRVDVDVRVRPEHVAARAHLAAGRTSQAEGICVGLIEADPADADAHHLLGLTRLLSGDAPAAVEHIRAAVALEHDAPEYRSNLAEALRRSGNVAQAEDECRRALELDPGYVNAHVNLGTCLHDLGEHRDALGAFDHALVLEPDDAGIHARRADELRALGQIHEAVSAYERALELDAEHQHAHANLGPLLLAVGRIDEALDHCRKAIELDPSSGKGYMNLGRCLRALEHLDDAMDAFADALERMPDVPELYVLIGEVWQESGALDQAEHWFRGALGLDPAKPESRCAMAGLRAELGRTDPPLLQEAIEEYRSVLAGHPDTVEAHLGISRALWDDGDADEAVAHLRDAADLRPQVASVHAQVGAIMASAGELDEAVDSYYRALGQNDRCVPALGGLAVALRGRIDPLQVVQIERLLEDPKLREGARATLHHGLAMHLEGAGEHARAAEHTLEANRLQWAARSKRGWSYDPENHAREVDRAIETFDRAHFERTAGWGIDDERPVFVVGMPRSGTTLVEQILSSHGRVFGAGERPFAARGWAQAPRELDRGAVRTLARWHLDRLVALVERDGRSAGEIDRITDKMPDNYNLLGWIATTFPRARIVHCRRDPRDVAVSCWTVQFGQIRWACHLEHIADRIVQYRRLMDHWRSTLPIPILEVDYEALVDDLEPQSRRLVDHLGLDWDPACLEYYKNDRLVRTASVTQVRQPVYTRSVGRWRNYSEALAPLIERLEAAGAIPA